MNVFSERIRISQISAFAAALLIWIFSASFTGLAGQAEASPMRDIERLIPPRTAVCFFEGEMFTDLVLNARGKLTFLYVDRKLSDALRRQHRAEYDNAAYSGIHPQIFAYAAMSKRRHVLFVVRVQALKSWNFDPSMLSIGDYSPVKENIITGIAGNPTTELKFDERALSPDYDGFIGFFVPADNVKAGETINLGYSTDHVEWQVPD